MWQCIFAFDSTWILKDNDFTLCTHFPHALPYEYGICSCGGGKLLIGIISYENWIWNWIQSLSLSLSFFSFLSSTLLFLLLFIPNKKGNTRPKCCIYMTTHTLSVCYAIAPFPFNPAKMTEWSTLLPSQYFIDAYVRVFVCGIDEWNLRIVCMCLCVCVYVMDIIPDFIFILLWKLWLHVCYLLVSHFCIRNVSNEVNVVDSIHICCCRQIQF